MKDFFENLGGRMFHFHRWTLWDVIEKGEKIDRDGGVNGNYWVQARRCEKCGLMQHKREIV